MTDDELRIALARLDPAPPALPPLPRDLLERTMTSDLTTPTVEPAVATTPNRRRWPVAAAAAVVLAAGGGAYVLSGGSDDPTPAGGELELALPDGTSMMSCIPVSAQFLADMPIALAGTVTAVGEQEVRLDVTRWYQGGDADTVVLQNAPAQQQALLGAADFRSGEDYLVSATADGDVSTCGFTGPATTELQSVYDEAFPG